jgi:hypothetical protein
LGQNNELEMIQFYETNIKNVAINFVGNKNSDEHVRYSQSVLNLDEATKDVLINYFINPFIQKQEYCIFYHDVR